MASRAWILTALLLGACTKTTSDGPDKAASQPAADGKVANAQADAKAGSVEALPAAEALLDKAVDAVGGKAKVEALKSFYVETTLAVAGQNITGEMKLWWQGGDFYLEQTMIGVGTIRSGKLGDAVWSEDPINGRRKLAGAEAEQNTWGSSLLLAAEWQRYFVKAETIAQREHDGKPAYDVELTSKGGAKVVMTFDADSGLQVAQRFTGVTPLGEMPISVDLRDYRDVEGLKLPYQQITDAKLATATQTITKIEVNGPVDTSKFAMPTGGAEVVKPATGP